MAKYVRAKPYNGELKDVDPDAFGLALRTANKSYAEDENDPTDAFYCTTDEDADFFEQFRARVECAWRKEDNRLREIEYKKQLVDFKKSLPAVGAPVFIEHPNNNGTCFPCVIEYIPPERDNVLIRYTEKSGTYGQSNLSLVGYSYPGAFVAFYEAVPEGMVVGH